MFTADIIQQLKQVNISIDTAKTSERTSEMWKSASKSDRGKILDLAGLKIVSIQRAYKTGKISAKIVVAMAQTLNINPYYLTGEMDEKEGDTIALIQQLLKAHNYAYLVDFAVKNERKEVHKLAKLATLEVQETQETSSTENEKDVEDEAIKGTNAETEEEIAERFENEMRAGLYEEAEKYMRAEASSQVTQDIVLTPEQKDILDGFTEDDMQTLMKAIILRAKIGGKNAELLHNSKLFLLS